jgi:glycosyltransferase involved in cell wall biosynthesis
MVTPRYLPHIGGVERYVHEVSTRLARDGLDVSVLTTDVTGELAASEEVEGVKIFRASAWPRKRDYYFAPGIYRHVRRGRWDVVHVQSYHTFVAPLAMLAARRAGVPYLVTFHAGGHSSWLRRAIRRPQWALLRPLLADAARLVVIARFEIDLYSRRLRLPPERFVLIPLGTDFARFKQDGDAAERPTPIIASIGRLERYKGHHRLIEALPKILDERPNATVWIAGAGPYEGTLRHLAGNLGVSKRVDIRAVDGSDREAMARELSKVALVVLLSEYETQPAAALEAIALGRPVLVLDTTGLAELAELGLARAIPRDSSAEEIAVAILEQLRDPFVPQGVELPTWDECAARHLDLYSELTKGDASAA